VRDALGDLGDEELRAELHRVADWIAGYRATIEQRAIVPAVEPGEIAANFPERTPVKGASMDEVMRELDTLIMPGIVHWGHPAFLGYFGSTSNGPALLGEMIAAALNVSAMTWRTSPAATELEGVVLAWIRELIGLPSAFMGIVYDTASVALMHALAAAREVAGDEIRRRGLVGRGAELRTLRVYTSDQAHSSVEKAMIVLGSARRTSCACGAMTGSGWTCERSSARSRMISRAACARWRWSRRWARRRRRASIRCPRSRRCVARTTRGYTSMRHMEARSRCCRSAAR